MTIGELRYTSVQDHAMVVSLNRDDMLERIFNTDGSPKNWMNRPLVGLADSARRKKPRPPADVSALIAGALVLNGHAKKALGPFLSKFGQLLELDCQGTGEIRYFYNLTNIVQCVDVERSERSDLGDVKMEVFDESKIPGEPVIFKDPATADVRIHVNDSGKALIEELITSAGLTGIACGPLTLLLW